MLDTETVVTLLDYNKDSGVYKWKKDRTGGTKRGDIAGSVKGDGYIYIRVMGKFYAAHRLAFLIVNGSLPPTGMVVDHINGDKLDNSFNNLRIVTQSINQQNRRAACKLSKTGLLGVKPLANGKFQARITVNGKRMHIGDFPCAESAHQAYIEAKRKLHKGCTI